MASFHGRGRKSALTWQAFAMLPKDKTAWAWRSRPSFVAPHSRNSIATMSWQSPSRSASFPSSHPRLRWQTRPIGTPVAPCADLSADSRLRRTVATLPPPSDRPAFRRGGIAFLQNVCAPKPASQRLIDCLLLQQEMNGKAGSGKRPMPIPVYGATKGYLSFYDTHSSIDKKIISRSSAPCQLHPFGDFPLTTMCKAEYPSSGPLYALFTPTHVSPCYERHGAFASMSARIYAPFRHVSSATCQSACMDSAMLRKLSGRHALTRGPLESGSVLMPASSDQKCTAGATLRLACNHNAEATIRHIVCSIFRNRNCVPPLAIAKSPSCHDKKFFKYF